MKKNGIWTILAHMCPFCAPTMRHHDDISRVSARQLCAEMSSGKHLTIFDVRHPLDTLGDSRCLPGATRIRPQDLAWGRIDLPLNDPIVVYCAMAEEAASAHAAHLLKHRKFRDVRVLEGGFGAWREAGLPLLEYQLSDAERMLAQQSSCRAHAGAEAVEV